MGDTHAANKHFILRARCADGAWLYVGEGGPTVSRANGVEFAADVVERRRDGARYVFDIPFEAVEADSERAD